MDKIVVQETQISLLKDKGYDYISLTDMAGAKNNGSRAADVIKNWLRNRYTIEFLGIWERIHNSAFKVVEFDHFNFNQIAIQQMNVLEDVNNTNLIK